MLCYYSESGFELPVIGSSVIGVVTVFNFTLFEITGVVVSDNAHELFLKFCDIIVEHPGFHSNQRIMVFDIC